MTKKACCAMLMALIACSMPSQVDGFLPALIPLIPAIASAIAAAPWAGGVVAAAGITAGSTIAAALISSTPAMAKFLFHRRLGESTSELGTDLDWHSSPEAEEADKDIRKFLHDHLAVIEKSMFSPEMQKEILKEDPQTIEQALTVSFEHWVELHKKEVSDISEKVINKVELLDDREHMAQHVHIGGLEAAKKALGQTPKSLAVILAGLFSVAGVVLMVIRQGLRQRSWQPTSEMADPELVIAE